VHPSLTVTPPNTFGTAAWQLPSALALGTGEQFNSGAVLSVTVKVAVQVDSLVAPSLTCSVTVVTPRPTSVPAVGGCVIDSGVEPLQSVATTPLVTSGAAAAQRPLAKVV